MSKKSDSKEILVNMEFSKDGKRIAISLECEDSAISEEEMFDAIAQCLDGENIGAPPGGMLQ